MTCFSKKDKDSHNPKYLWYENDGDVDSLKKHCPEDAGNPVTPEGGSNDDGGKDKRVSTYFHVEIF